MSLKNFTFSNGHWIQQEKAFKNLWNWSHSPNKMIISTCEDGVVPMASGFHVTGGCHSRHLKFWEMTEATDCEPFRQSSTGGNKGDMRGCAMGLTVPVWGSILGASAHILFSYKKRWQKSCCQSNIEAEKFFFLCCWRLYFYSYVSLPLAWEKSCTKDPYIILSLPIVYELCSIETYVVAEQTVD